MVNSWVCSMGIICVMNCGVHIESIFFLLNRVADNITSLFKQLLHVHFVIGKIIGFGGLDKSKSEHQERFSEHLQDFQSGI